MPALCSLSLSKKDRRFGWKINQEHVGNTDHSISFSSILSVSTYPTPDEKENFSTTLLVRHVRKSVKEGSPFGVADLEFRCRTADEADEWKETLLEVIGSKNLKKVLLIVNPAAGDGNAQSVVDRCVSPILESAGVTPTLIVTEKPLKLMCTIRQLENLLDFEAILACGGDGLLHELVNGILTRSDWEKASLIPVAVVPAGKRNLTANTLLITHPLMSLLSLLNSPPTKRPIIGLTTKSGLRIFSHSQVAWTPPPPPPTLSWLSSLGKPRPLTFSFNLHYLPLTVANDDRANPPTPRPNQPGPPLSHPCLAPSTLPKSWMTTPLPSAIIIDTPPSTSSTTTACLNLRQLVRGTVVKPLPASAVLVALAPLPVQPRRKSAPAKGPSPMQKRYGANLQCFPGGRLVVDGQPMEPGPFAAESVQGAGVMVVAPTEEMVKELGLERDAEGSEGHKGERQEYRNYGEKAREGMGGSYWRKSTGKGVESDDPMIVWGAVGLTAVVGVTAVLVSRWWSSGW
ncbi:Sphingosine kinase 1 [Irineochytrium annulatum]|nr:Sphingosine kinase 1 [Irineochytrium annulatum]